MLPDNVLLSFIFILLSAAFILMFISTDVKESLESFKTGFNKGQMVVTSFLDGINIFEELRDYTEYLIGRSGLCFYNTWVHLFICTIAGIAAYRASINSVRFLPALSFAILVIVTPYAALKLIGDFMAERERKYGIDFLIILNNFLKSSAKHDIFEAFENVIPYVVQPIRRYVEEMIFEYKHKINPVTCLERLKDNINTPELRLYIDNISICYVQGGDMEGLTQAYIDEMSIINDDDDKEDAEDKMLNYGLYVLLGLNFAVVYWTLNGSYKLEILGNFIGQLIFTIDMAVSMYIIYMTLKKT